MRSGSSSSSPTSVEAPGPPKAPALTHAQVAHPRAAAPTARSTSTPNLNHPPPPGAALPRRSAGRGAPAPPHPGNLGPSHKSLPVIAGIQTAVIAKKPHKRCQLRGCYRLASIFCLGRPVACRPRASQNEPGATLGSLGSRSRRLKGKQNGLPPASVARARNHLLDGVWLYRGNQAGRGSQRLTRNTGRRGVGSPPVCSCYTSSRWNTGSFFTPPSFHCLLSMRS